MPTYVYRCDSCSHQFETFQKMSDDPLDTCPQCEAKVRRVIHPVGIVFKGSGWYINDSKTSNASTTEPATPKSDGSDSTTPAATGTDTSSTTKEPAKTAAD